MLPLVFLGITPGKTKINNVGESIRDHLTLDFIPSCSFERSNEVLECSLHKHGTVYFSSNLTTSIVSGVGYAPHTHVYLDMVIEAYGEPDTVRSVAVPDRRAMFIVQLYYDQIQTIVDLQEVENISESTKIAQFLFFDGDSYLEEIQSQYQSPWRGYGMYP